MLQDLLQESYDAMRHNRRRTALTMLGMAWGIATVVMLLSYGDGFGNAITNIMANFGTKLMIVVLAALPCRPAVRRRVCSPLHIGRYRVTLHQYSPDTHITRAVTRLRRCNMTRAPTA